MAALFNRIPLPFTRMPLNVDGYPMAAHTLDRYLALWLWKLGLVESFESELVTQLCCPGMAAVDVGANIGRHTLLLSRCVGSHGHVWAFEPDRGNFAALERNLKYNHCANVTAVNAAVSDRSGKQDLYISRSHSGDHRLYRPPDTDRTAIAVDVISLDDFFPSQQRLDWIKMDIQGAEGLALSGMKGILKRNPHVTILLEFWPKGLMEAGSEPEQVLAELTSMGFRIELLDGKEKRLIRIGDLGKLVQSLHDDQYADLLVRVQDSTLFP